MVGWFVWEEELAPPLHPEMYARLSLGLDLALLIPGENTCPMIPGYSIKCMIFPRSTRTILFWFS